MKTLRGGLLTLALVALASSAQAQHVETVENGVLHLSFPDHGVSGILWGPRGAVAVFVAEPGASAWPRCFPCQPASAVDLSVLAGPGGDGGAQRIGWYDFPTLGPAAGIDAMPTLILAAGAVTLPPLPSGGCPVAGGGAPVAGDRARPETNAGCFSNPPAGSSSWTAPGVAFDLVLIENVETTPNAILPGLVVVGKGIATATFTKFADGWHLQDITYTVLR